MSLSRWRCNIVHPPPLHTFKILSFPSHTIHLFACTTSSSFLLLEVKLLNSLFMALEQADHNSTVAVEWPEPIHRVQQLAESGLIVLPPRYVRPSHERVCVASAVEAPPVVDLSALLSEGREMIPCQEKMKLSNACREWGVFQVVNHGIKRELISRATDACRGFFELPMEQKIEYANDPVTYVGYGSRMGVKKGVTLDWNDYFFHNLWPLAADGYSKWPRQPAHYRETIREYGENVMGLCKTLLSMFSKDLVLEENSLLDSFGGEEGLGGCFRMNYYPKCPQHELVLGLSSHTDPGCFTFILQDQVSGLQVKKNGVWVSVPPIQDSLVVVIGDQLEIISNGIYKSVEHRSAVNGEKERMSLVVFVNPDGNINIGPHQKLVQHMTGLALYTEMTFTQYRKFIRTLGVQGRDIIAKRRTTS